MDIYANTTAILCNKLGHNIVEMSMDVDPKTRKHRKKSEENETTCSVKVQRAICGSAKGSCAMMMTVTALEIQLQGLVVARRQSMHCC